MANVIAAFGCSKYPKLRIRDLQFDDGVLEVSTEEDATLVRGADGFGVFIQELDLNKSYDVQPETSEGRARTGMRSAGDPSELPQEDQPQSSDPAEAASVFPEPNWPQDKTPDISDVVVKAGGWYEYEGKNCRKSDLPESLQKLL
jgi:hypothetical protein